MTPTSARTRTDPPPGATEHSPGQVSFALWAPGKQSVQLLGDFNGWNRENGWMEANHDGLWSIHLELAPGRYCYQFLIDGQTLIGDPYARVVESHPANEPTRSVVEVGRQPFAWQHDGWQRPAFQDLVICELHVADFSAEGTFQSVTQRLDYLVSLGINAIQLLPVSESTTDDSWGYDPTVFFAVRDEYGTPDDLKTLIDQAHARGIAVILDFVLAHTSRQHPFHSLYPYDQSPWYGEGIGGTNEFGLPTLDHRKEPTRLFCRDVQDFWLREYHADGFRYDYAKLIGQDGEQGMPFLVQQARRVLPEAYLIGEYVPEDPGTIEQAGLSANWHVRFCNAIGSLSLNDEYKYYNAREGFERCIRVIDPLHEEYPSAISMINYIESHDEQRLILLLRNAGHEGYAARRTLALAATVLMTAPGVPMTYHGQEFGEAAHKSVNERIPLHWDLLSTKGGQGLFEHYQRVIGLRRQHPALRSNNLHIDRVDPERHCAVWNRWDGDDNVVVAVNFSADRQAVDVPFPRGGRWREVFTDQSLEVHDAVEYELDPIAAAIFVRE